MSSPPLHFSLRLCAAGAIPASKAVFPHKPTVCVQQGYNPGKHLKVLTYAHGSVGVFEPRPSVCTNASAEGEAARMNGIVTFQNSDHRFLIGKIRKKLSEKKCLSLSC